MKMVIYIHGFGSSGQGGKSMQFRAYFKAQGIPYIAPSLSYVPALAISTLEELIESYEDVTLIGSSLGGYYAMYLAEKYRLKAILINPAMKSDKNLKRSIYTQGYATNYYDDSSFEWNEKHIAMLDTYDVTEVNSEYLLMLQKGDEVLDYREAIRKIPHATIIIEEGGTHAFEGVERHFEMIRDF